MVCPNNVEEKGDDKIMNIIFFIVVCPKMAGNVPQLKEVRCLEPSAFTPSNVYTKIQMFFSGGK
jgi:hypothetical protein